MPSLSIYRRLTPEQPNCATCNLLPTHHTAEMMRNLEAGTWTIRLSHGAVFGRTVGSRPARMTDTRFTRCADAYDAAYILMVKIGGRHKLHIGEVNLRVAFNEARPDRYQPTRQARMVDGTMSTVFDELPLTEQELEQAFGPVAIQLGPGCPCCADMGSSRAGDACHCIDQGPCPETGHSSSVTSSAPPPAQLFPHAPPSVPATGVSSLYGIEVRVSQHVPADQFVFVNSVGDMLNSERRPNGLTLDDITNAVARLRSSDLYPAAIMVSPNMASEINRVMADRYTSSDPDRPRPGRRFGQARADIRYTDSPGSDDPLEG